jgi:DNA-binding transcriptional regulator YiaG
MAQMRQDMDILMAGMAELKGMIPEDHPLIHEAISRKFQSLSERMDGLEDVLSLPASPKPRQIDQRDVLRALLAQTSDGKWVPANMIRQKMNLGKDEFSRLLKVSEGFVQIKKDPFDRRKMLLKIS